MNLTIVLCVFVRTKHIVVESFKSKKSGLSSHCSITSSAHKDKDASKIGRKRLYGPLPLSSDKGIVLQQRRRMLLSEKHMSLLAKRFPFQKYTVLTCQPEDPHIINIHPTLLKNLTYKNHKGNPYTHTTNHVPSPIHHLLQMRPHRLLHRLLPLP